MNYEDNEELPQFYDGDLELDEEDLDQIQDFDNQDLDFEQEDRE